MQEKFTRQAVNALKLARSTVQSCKHTYIGTEHILVGLLKEKEGTAGRILEEFGVEQERLQELIGNLIAPSEVLTMERVPEYSPRAQRLLDNAGKEAQMRRADQAGTEHILLAMLKETESVATRLLYTMGVNIQKLYAAVLAAMGCDQEAIAEEMQASRNLKDKKGIVPQALPFYAGNKFYLFYKKIYPDVRMVAAPPSSIGKFGGETDNWMWPRHTGDFSMFRIYADANGEPAEYSANNTPLKTKKHLSISLKGLKEGDYAMIMGFPGSTSRYLTVSEVKERMESENDPRIRIRGARLAVLKEVMNASDKIRIQYANKYAGSSNYWKNSIGMNRAIIDNDVLGTKAAQEAKFAEFAKEKNNADYATVVKKIDDLVAKTAPLNYQFTCLRETFFGAIEFGSVMLAKTREALIEKNDSLIKVRIEALKDTYESIHNKDYDHEVDRKVAKVLFPLYAEMIPADQRLSIYKVIEQKYKGNYDKFVDDMYDNSIFSNRENFEKFVKKPSVKAIDNDLALQYCQSKYDQFEKIVSQLEDMDKELTLLHKTYIRGLGEMKQPVPSYPDANFTIRLTYGNVKPYDPKDGVHYNYYTTTKGILEKENPEDREFVVPAKLKELIEKKDYGRYALPNGDMPVCFLSTNDITGGNSGSPVLNENGELIGCAFDGNWESLSGDINFDNNLQRCINLDIRYVLFILEKLGNCGHLINEMTIVE